jgi:queuine tRNA-ribosyltransferase
MSLPTAGFAFETLAKSGNARRARFTTPRAVIETPTFMPVGTQATVKGLTSAEVAATGAKIILSNTYHLWLRPGAELIDARGGVPKFMAWPHAMLTDSGGYQVFSLAERRTIDEDGVTFRSHLDGSKCRLTPEESMRVQNALRSDVAMVLDVCPPAGAPRTDVEDAMRKTSRWASRCLASPAAEGQSRFGIVQGGVHLDLRRSHLDEIAALDFDGIALGGFSVGEPPEVMYQMVADLGPRMPGDKPRYVMGVGTPFDLLHLVGAGIDVFDCVLPTRNGRNGQALTWHGRVNMKQQKHREDEGPIDPECTCPVCATYSRSYLRHLFKVEEMLGPRLVTEHNLHFYAALMARARLAIEADEYGVWSRSAMQRMRDGDEVGPPQGAPAKYSR